MNTYQTRKITGTNGDSTRPIRLDPKKPMPHIICKEALPHMERPPLLFAAAVGAVIGAVVGATLAVLFI